MARVKADVLRGTQDEIIKADEVAALLRMTPAWVYSETRRNRIPHMRLGRYFRYRRSAIEAWMRGLEQGSNTHGNGPCPTSDHRGREERPKPGV